MIIITSESSILIRDEYKWEMIDLSYIYSYIHTYVAMVEAE